MILWPTARGGVSKNAGVWGSLTFYNPACIGYNANSYTTAYLNYTGLLYGPYAASNYGCQIFSSGSYATGNYNGTGPYATGIQFYFKTGLMNAGTVKVYGWN